MIYGVPQKGRDYKTKRVKHIRFDSETFQDELLLTMLERAMDGKGVKQIIFVTEDKEYSFLMSQEGE